MPRCLSLFLTLLLTPPWLLISTILLGYGPSPTQCMTPSQIRSLRQESRDIFYHGLTNYIRHAFPEDELRPLSCTPLTRDRANPAHIEVNDVLGNYSLSLVDSLSTLAILASDATSEHDAHDALRDFQRYISLLVEEYGDGTAGAAGQGRRARGFDLDSKVQLFETTIRGLGGLLSAHLFAVGDLPIRGYTTRFEMQDSTGRDGMVWDVYDSGGKKFVYDGQLLRLAYDLGKRLLPAFHTETGIPYPRVNLRTGIPFYENSPLNNDAEHGQCEPTQTPKTDREITETCSAGAGSLVLEFSVLSRLTGDMRFERLAKKAFWAVWDKRTTAGLIGSGIDAETGQWISPYTGIGAGIDSFFEYAFKSHILLSGLETFEHDDGEPSSTSFLEAWEASHAAIKRHIYRGPQFQHPHYAQNDMWTGGPRLAWIDSLSAYYPGLLALAGEVEEATTAHLLYTALWTRYGALPERWNTFTGKIDAGLRWWGGRPEFIESNWYLYRATKDPWYLHVAEMALRDIKRRCWTPCGWAGLQDVRTGEQSDRMESFFLGETAKYLYLTFDPDHPLNHLDAPLVFTTEGHPLIIPKHYRPLDYELDADPVTYNAQCPAPRQPQPLTVSTVATRADIFHAALLGRLHDTSASETLPIPDPEQPGDYPKIDMNIPSSPTNRTFYPWTLPIDLIPALGTCAKMALRQTFDLTFPALPNTITDFGALQRIENGILIKSISGLRLALVLDDDPIHPGQEVYRIYALSNLALGRDEGIWLTNNVLSQLNPVDPNLSRMKDTEIVDLIIDAPTPVMPTTQALPSETPGKDAWDSQLLDFFAGAGLDVGALETSTSPGEVLLRALPQVLLSDTDRLADHLESLADLNLPSLNIDKAFRDAAAGLRSGQSSLLSNSDTGKSSSSISGPSNRDSSPVTAPPLQLKRHLIPAMLPSGPGAAPLPAKTEAIPDPATLPLGGLTFRSILPLDTDLCNSVLPANIPRRYNVLAIRRGGCSFSQKLRNVPSFPPTEAALKVVVVVSGQESEEGDAGGQGSSGGYGTESFFVRPFLDERQATPAGTERRNALPLVMCGGGKDTWNVLERAGGVSGWVDGEGKVRVKRRGEDGFWREVLEHGQGSGPEGSEGGEEGEASEEVDQETRLRELEKMGGGISLKRRYWFASNGIRIVNLHVA